MENFDTNVGENIKNDLETRGVTSVRNEKGYYVLDIIWKDSKRGEYRFPESGFEVVNPITKERIAYVRPNEAIEILKNNAKNYNQGEFNWLDFVG